MVLGGVLSSVFSMLWGKREYRILIIGLDSAGKTTILYRLQVNSRPSTVLSFYSPAKRPRPFPVHSP